jgi:hypothetical protein
MYDEILSCCNPDFSREGKVNRSKFEGKKLIVPLGTPSRVCDEWLSIGTHSIGRFILVA